MSATDANVQAVGRERYGLDVASAEVLAFALHNTSVQMHRALMRSAFSAVVRDVMDCTSSINVKTPHGWETVAEMGPSLHAPVSGHVCNFVLEEYGEENLRKGDVLIHNDPWRGAVHQSDVSILRGVFVDGELTFVLESCSHLVDMGGPVAGGYPTGARYTFEENLRIPPSLLYAEDVPVRGMFNMLLESTRVPQLNLGDLRALYGSVVVGERLLEDLCAREGRDRVHRAALYALDAAEASMRAAIARVPDGDYSAEDVLDDDGVNAEPLLVKATVRIRRDRMELDFSGTERQAEGNSTTAWCDSSRGIIPVKMLLDPQSLYNGGALRPFEAVMPPGSLVLGLPPTSVSDHGSIGTRVTNVVMAALNKALPDEQAVACDAGNPMFLGLQGVDTRPGRGHAPFGTFVLPGASWGATSKNDGLGFSTILMTGGVVRSSVYEHVEREAPVIFWEHAFMIDSAGVGKLRGGVGVVVTVEALAPVEIACVADRIRVGSPGYGGGGRSMPTLALLVRKGADGVTPAPSWNGVTAVSDFSPVFGVFDEQGRPNPYDGQLGRGAIYEVSKFSRFMLEAGQVLRICAGGGAGWGDALEREPVRVLNDVLDEFVSPEAALADYGVVLAVADDGAVVVDEAATSRQRQRLAEERQRTGRETISCFRPWPLTGDDVERLRRPLAERVEELRARSA